MSEQWTIWICSRHGVVPVPVRTEGRVRTCSFWGCDHSVPLREVEVVPLARAEKAERERDELRLALGRLRAGKPESGEANPDE